MHASGCHMHERDTLFSHTGWNSQRNTPANSHTYTHTLSKSHPLFLCPVWWRLRSDMHATTDADHHKHVTHLRSADTSILCSAWVSECHVYYLYCFTASAWKKYTLLKISLLITSGKLFQSLLKMAHWSIISTTLLTWSKRSLSILTQSAAKYFLHGMEGI